MTSRQKIELVAAIVVLISLLVMSSISDFHTPRDYKGITGHNKPAIFTPYDATFTDEIKRLNK